MYVWGDKACIQLVNPGGELLSIQVLDVNGVLRKSFTDNATICTIPSGKGVYIVQIESAKGKVTEKVIVK